MKACFESASLDTNILIHLWKSGTEETLANMFGKAYVYQWLLDVELRHHAEKSLIEKVFAAMDIGFLEPVDDRTLKKRGLYGAFRDAYENVSMFFSGPDTGEGYAIALAQVFGIPVLVTDDTKKDGPKWYLNLRAQKPFAFSSDEVLLVGYLRGDINEAEYLQKFQAVSEINGLNWRPRICLDRFRRRFLGELAEEAPGSLRDHQWAENFAEKYKIDIKEKLNRLRQSLPPEPVLEHAPRTRAELLLSERPLACPSGKEEIWERYRILYKHIRERKLSLDVATDVVIACVLKRLGYGQKDIEGTIENLAPGAESNPMYHKLAYMGSKRFEDERVIIECCEAVGRERK